MHGLLKTSALALLATAILQSPAKADQAADINAIQQEWDRVSFTLDKKQQEVALESLMKKAGALTQQYPQVAEAWIWNGIVHASYAGAAGGLSALGHCKSAKADFEKAISLNPSAMNGAAYTSLGSLYYQVPGWPIGFGDDEKARQHLQKGLQYGPQDLDAHYFYGDFLLEQKQYAEAVKVLNQALATPVDNKRPLFQQGRREKLESMIKSAEVKLK